MLGFDQAQFRLLIMFAVVSLVLVEILDWQAEHEKRLWRLENGPTVVKGPWKDTPHVKTDK